MFLPIDADEFNDSILTVLKVEPKVKYIADAEEGAADVQEVQAKTKVPLWLVTASYEHANDFEPENFQVRIAHEGEPGIVPGPIRFGGLSVRTWNMNSKKGWSISADTWTQEPRPSSKRPAKQDSPPPAPVAAKTEVPKAS